MALHKVSGSKLFEWINKFYPFIHDMYCVEIKDNKYIYLISADLFSCPFHTLVRDKIEVHTELNKSIPIGSYFKCYNDQYSYALKLINADLV